MGNDKESLNISREAILAQMLKMKEGEIRNALSQIKDYKIVKVPKRGGGHRTLYIPPDPLKKVQRRILKYLLWRMFKTYWVGVYGISRGTSYVQHAKEHKNAKWVFQFDLKDAFSSVNVSHLKKILQESFLEELDNFEFVQRELRKSLEDLERVREKNDEAELSFVEDFLEEWEKETRVSIFSSTDLPELMILKEDKWILPKKEEIAQGLADLVLELTTYQGILPQGTPTAPFLFYLALTEGGLIEKLDSACPLILPKSHDRYKFRLSVYVDNFVISAQKPIPRETQEKIFKIIEELGLKINPKKIRHQGIIHGAPLITGLRVIRENSEGKVVLPKKKVRQIRGLIHRAIFDPSLRPKVQGLIASLRPIYGIALPPQLEKPYKKLLQKILQ
jgi:hypothetical protein